jgi:hypothetical protein
VSCPKYSYERALRHGEIAPFRVFTQALYFFHDSRHAGALNVGVQGLVASVTDRHLVARQLGHGMDFASAGGPRG